MSGSSVRKICLFCKRPVVTGASCARCGDLCHKSCAERANAIVHGNLSTSKCACFDQPDSDSDSPHAEDADNFFDADSPARGPPPPYESLTPPPAVNDVGIASSASVAFDTSSQAASLVPDDPYSLLREIRNLTTAVNLGLTNTNASFSTINNTLRTIDHRVSTNTQSLNTLTSTVGDLVGGDFNLHHVC